jgi:hypothetical protein
MVLHRVNKSPLSGPVMKQMTRVLTRTSEGSNYVRNCHEHLFGFYCETKFNVFSADICAYMDSRTERLGGLLLGCVTFRNYPTLARNLMIFLSLTNATTDLNT